MAAAVQFVPVTQVREERLSPPARGPVDVLGEDGAAGRGCHGRLAELAEAFPVDTGGRGTGGRQPVHHQVVEQVVPADHGGRVAVVVGPGVELLDDPARERGRGVDQAVADALRAGRLLLRVSSPVPAVGGERGQRGLLRLRQVVLPGAGRRQCRHHVQVDAGQRVGVPLAEVHRDERSPVAALRSVALVAEPVHELVPGGRDVLGSPAGRGGLAAEPEAWQRRADHVEGVGGVAPVLDWVGQRPDDLVELDNRAGPAVGQHQRGRVEMRGADMQEVDVQPVDRGQELREVVQPRVGGRPVVVLKPVPAQFLEVGQRRALRPVAHSLRVRPPGPAQPFAQVRDVGVGDVNLERPDVIVHAASIPRRGPPLSGGQPAQVPRSSAIRYA